VQSLTDTFVDDTSLTVTEEPCTTSTATYQKITMSIRELSQKEKRALFVSGGALELTIFLWYLLPWLWDHRGRSYLASSIEAPLTLSRTQGDKLLNHMDITRLEPSDPHLTLGCYLNITGNCKRQHEVLVETSTDYATAV
jgi:hypothetical protein